MLPDIDQQDWSTYEQSNLADELKRKMDGFGLQHAIGEKMAGLQSLLGGAPPEPAPAPPSPPPPEPAPAPTPPVEQGLANIGGWAPPDMSGSTPDMSGATAPEPGQNLATTAPAPVTPPQAPSIAPATTPQPAAGGSLSDWYDQVWQQGIGAVAQSGGNVQQFSDDLWNRLQGGVQDANDAFGHGLAAASGAGANLQQFASGFDPNPPPPPQAADFPLGGAGPAGAPITASGVPDWLTSLIAKNAPELANDPEFIRTVAAGAKAESGWDVNRVQSGFRPGSGGGARGLFQFDLGGMGAGIPEEQLLGDRGAELQASRIVPLYAKAYASAPAGLSGAEKASWVAAQAERPFDYQNPQSAARRNYASAFNEISAGPGLTPTDQLGRVGDWAQGAALRPATQISQFGNPQLSADEAYAACGPAAAVRFAQMYGRNPTLREATDLAATVGWTSSQGMAGIGSQKALMDKLGVPTRVVGADINAMAAEAQTGNPVTISTPGHYFFADGYDPNTGAFHVGQSGLDLRGGSEWMTPDQMTNRMGAIQGALFADHPRVPSPSLAGQDANPLEWLGRQKDAALSKLGFTPPPEEPSVIAAHVDSSHPDVRRLDQAIDASVVAAHSPQPVADELTQTMASVGSPTALGTQPQAEPSVWDKVGSGISEVFKNAFGAPGTADNPLSGAQALGMGAPGATGVGNEVASAIGQSAGERLGGIQRIETGNPFVDLPLAAPSAAASAFGTGVRTALDVTNELLPTTHLGRLYEGLSGDIRRDPEYNALLQQQVDLTNALYNAPTGEEQVRIRNLLQQNQAAVDQRKQAIGATGPQDLESAYRAGLASPDRPNVEAISSLAMLPVSGAGAAESAPAALRAITTATDPLALAMRGARIASPALRQTGQIQSDVAARLGGAAAGGYAGYQSTPEDASIQERLLRTGGGALAGLGATEAALRGGARLVGGRTPAAAATGNAELDRVLDMHAAQDRQAPLLGEVAERAASILGLGGRTGDLDRAAADRFAYINQLTGRAKQALGSAFTPEMDAEAYVAAYAGRGARALQRVRDEITPALDMVRENDDLANLNALRKLERNREVAQLYGGARTASAGVNDVQTATDAINALEASMTPERWQTLRQANSMINDATARLLTERANAGLIDPDLAARLIAEQPHYNPTVLMRHLDEGAGMGQGDKFTVTNNFLRRLAAEGSADDTEKPINSLIRHFVQNDVLINRNQTAQAILGAAQEDPTLAGLIKRVNPMRPVTGPEIGGPGGPANAPGNIATVLERRFGDQPGLVSMYENGQRVYYQVPEGLEQAMKGLDAKTAGVVAKVFKTLNAPLRWGATAASPPFLVTNALADAVTTYLREGAGTAARIPMGWWEAARQGDLYQNYMRAGGGMESLFQRSGLDTLMQRPENWEQLTRESGGLVPHGPEDISRWVGDALKLNWIRRAGEVIEQGPRLATFERHLNAGEAPVQAAVAGRRATVDFSRAGDALREANMLSLFLNARTQGTLNTARTLRDNPESRLRLATLATLDAGLNHYNRQFPEYWDIPEYERRQNAIVMLPGSEKDPSGPGWKKINRVSIPLREWSLFTDPLNHALSQLDANPAAKDPRTWQDLAKDELSTLSPVAGNDPSAAAAGLLPAPIRSMPEIAANRRFYTGLPIVPREYEGLPPSAQANERTSVLGRKLGEALGVSPMQIDFLINENLGTLGRTALGAIDTLAGKPSDSIPVIGGLTSGIVRNYGGQIAADKYDKLDQLMGQFQEPIAQSVRQLPEYTDATPDRQNDMLRGAQLHLRDTLRDQLGISGSTKDTGLPQKYPGVTDPQEAVRIDRAVSRWNAYKADPAHAPVPTNEEVQLASLYGNIVSPLYRIESQQDEQQNRAIRSMVEEQLATRQGR